MTGARAALVAQPRRFLGTRHQPLMTVASEGAGSETGRQRPRASREEPVDVAPMDRFSGVTTRHRRGPSDGQVAMNCAKSCAENALSR